MVALAAPEGIDGVLRPRRRGPVGAQTRPDREAAQPLPITPATDFYPAPSRGCVAAAEIRCRRGAGLGWRSTPCGPGHDRLAVQLSRLIAARSILIPAAVRLWPGCLSTIGRAEAAWRSNASPGDNLSAPYTARSKWHGSPWLRLL
jgi:hypothetical protein